MGKGKAAVPRTFVASSWRFPPFNRPFQPPGFWPPPSIKAGVIGRTEATGSGRELLIWAADQREGANQWGWWRRHRVWQAGRLQAGSHCRPQITCPVWRCWHVAQGFVQGLDLAGEPGA
ncbi:hypothetical protein GGTG_00434 [Gaeumannomyces tritici R3-111a-1]|uniref:Uncharacterized protein n=1 Tax=Gaeumannomyces tritici (strain R3-111a-1) TaxID=644352 RepID=J3NGP5_GAET3|nr:hypothetical protein GGTG_00434 [Gaeumannomyces tritici R3-111a-1]EJT80435.1 hypothetical protein GGTG_00434 [Gaeumannomyces tritici R3-111a-1]